MTATLTTLTTKPDKLRLDQADQLRSALAAIEAQMELPFELMRAVYTEVEKRTAGRKKWTFVMISPEQNSDVVQFLAQHSSRPIIAMQLWAMCFKHLRYETGEILLTRDELADKMGQTSNNISTIMSELEEFGAIIKLRQKVGGMKGRGLVRYFMNPRVATHLSGPERDVAQTEAPSLTVVQGGKAD